MEGAPENTLHKDEILSGTVSISALTSKGRWGNCRMLKYCFLSPNGLDRNRIMVSVPKKLFKRAVKRNLLKRRIRESYRTQKGLLPGGTDVLFVYNSAEILPFEEIRANVAAIMEKINSANDGKRS